MTHRLAALLAATSLAVAAAPAAAQNAGDTMSQPAAAAPAPAYPATERGDTVETLFGEPIADPYRWLENDVRNDAEVAAWVAAQNKVTDAYLDALPLKDAFKARMTELYDYERYGLPRKRGNSYFYAKNDGLQNQSVLYVRDGLNGAPRVLIDPTGWSKDGATALAEWTPSEDGKLLAYAVQDGGTD
ncbi:MAG: S9 family peptidase, partial [Cypionkella sp.]